METQTARIAQIVRIIVALKHKAKTFTNQSYMRASLLEKPELLLLICLLKYKQGKFIASYGTTFFRINADKTTIRRLFSTYIRLLHLFIYTQAA